MDDKNIGFIVELLRRAYSLPLPQHSKEDLQTALREGLQCFADSIRNPLVCRTHLKIVPITVTNSIPRRLASIQISENVPAIGSKKLARTCFKIKVSTSYLLNASTASVAFTSPHEMTHVLLRSTRFPLYRSERATEICAMMLGYDQYAFDAYEYTEQTMEFERHTWWKRFLGIPMRHRVVFERYCSPYMTLDEYTRVAEETALIRVMRKTLSRTS